MRVTREEASAAGIDVPAKRSKYRNEPVTVDNVRFHSKREAKRYSELKLLEKAGQIFDLELQPKFVFVVNGVKLGTYTADFCYVDTVSGWAVVEDVKGVRTQQYRLRKKLLKALHGIEVVEM